MSQLSTEALLLQRLEYIEHALTRAGILQQTPSFGSPVSDPPPIDIRRVDDLVRFRISELLSRYPGWISDPPPEDFLNVKVLDLIRRYRGGFTDPAPDELATIRLSDLIRKIPIGVISDPPPIDLPNLSIAELEGQLHKLNSEFVRLESLKKAIVNRIQQIQEKEG